MQSPNIRQKLLVHRLHSVVKSGNLNQNKCSMKLSLSSMLIYILMKIFLTEVKVQNKTQTILGKPVKNMADAVREMMKLYSPVYSSIAGKVAHKSSLHMT